MRGALTELHELTLKIQNISTTFSVARTSIKCQRHVQIEEEEVSTEQLQKLLSVRRSRVTPIKAVTQIWL